jgi:phage I-like protein
MKLTAVALLAAALTLQASASTQLLPAGEFVGRDGRPGKGLKWKLSDAKGRALAAKLNERHTNTRFNLDYEHQAMVAQETGNPAPASGWASKFEWRDGVGLFATDTQWTARAKQMIEAGEYLYISPVILYDTTTGEVTDILNAALLNVPNLLDMDPVAHERVARLNASFSTATEQSSMNAILKALLEGLGLPATDATTEAQATAALTSLKTARSDLTALLKSLGVAETTEATAACTAIAALRAKADKAGQGGGEPDPTKWVSLDKFNELNTQVAQLRASSTGREVDELIAQAKNEGKLMPAAEEVWRNVGKADIAQLRALIEKTPANPALAGQQQTDGKAPAGGDDKLNETELAICKATGIDPKDYAATKKDVAVAA